MNNFVFGQIGADIESTRGLFWVTETDKHFWQFMSHIQVERFLPEDWYPRAENGEMFECRLEKGIIVNFST